MNGVEYIPGYQEQWEGVATPSDKEAPPPRKGDGGEHDQMGHSRWAELEWVENEAHVAALSQLPR